MLRILNVLVIPLLIFFLAMPVHADWDFSKHSIPVEDIRGGGPPKDGIPALFNPKYLTAKEANKLLKPDERVLGLSIKGVSRAYPIRIMSWHELVNDEIGGIPYLVSW
jgi:hypothetical protein